MNATVTLTAAELSTLLAGLVARAWSVEAVIGERTASNTPLQDLPVKLERIHALANKLHNAMMEASI